MANIKNALLAGGSALLLALSLGACGGSESANQTDNGSTTSAEEPKTYSQDAAVHPEDIHPGWVLDSDNNVGGTSDLWYPVTDDSSAEGLYFTNAGNDAGMDVTFVDNDGGEDSVWDLEVVDDHLKTKADASDKRQVDITFQDDFTCYDAVSGTTYLRGASAAKDYEELFTAKAFVLDKDDPEKRMMSFADDGTVTLTTGDKVASGTWKVAAVNMAEVHFKSDTSEWDDEYRVILDEGGNAIELDEGGSTNLVAFKG